MKKILVSAYSVSPFRGSECAVGWEITRRLGQYFDVTVLMCKETPSGDKYAQEVESFLSKNGQIPNVKFIGVSMPKVSKVFTFLHDIGFWPAFYWGYNCWQKNTFKTAKNLSAFNNYDLAYQLNMIGFREPGYLWKLDIPFILGPTNGFHSIPFSFLKNLKGKDYIFQNLKHIFNEIQIKTAVRPKNAAKKASLVFCVDEICQKHISKWAEMTDLLTETGLSTKETPIVIKKMTYGLDRPLKLVWSGMITPGKALSILLDALLLNKDLNFKLTVLGDGPLLKDMKVKAEIINHKIEWKGWLNKDEATIIVSNSDLLIHTSLKEGTPHVILEAISHGVPVICHDTCGMGIVVNDQNGFKIPYKDFNTSILYISNTLKSIFENPEILNNKFESIKETTDLLSWDSKVKYISGKINEILYL